MPSKWPHSSDCKSATTRVQACGSALATAPHPCHSVRLRFYAAACVYVHVGLCTLLPRCIAELPQSAATFQHHLAPPKGRARGQSLQGGRLEREGSGTRRCPKDPKMKGGEDVKTCCQLRGKRRRVGSGVLKGGCGERRGGDSGVRGKRSQKEEGEVKQALRRFWEN